MNRLKMKWADGGSVVGLWATLGSSLATEMLARAGLDYVCIDNQHGVNDYSSTVGQLQAVDCGDATPLVRVPWNEPGIIGKMLDAGAEGIIIPMVNSVAEAEAAVRSCRYAPQGARSFGPVRSGIRTPDYFATANDDVLCIPMIETAQALESIDDILDVPGIDAIYVGPADLAVSLGVDLATADDDPLFVQALDTIVAACQRHDVIPGIHGSIAIAKQRLGLGFRMVTVTADSVAMRVGLAQASGAAAGDSIY